MILRVAHLLPWWGWAGAIAVGWVGGTLITFGILLSSGEREVF